MKERSMGRYVFRRSVQLGATLALGVALASCAGARGPSPFAGSEQSRRVQGYTGLADPLSGTPVPLRGEVAAVQPTVPQPEAGAGQPPAQPPAVEPPPVPEVPQAGIQIRLSGFPDTGPLLSLQQVTRYHDLAVPDGHGGTSFRAIALEEGFWYRDSVSNPDVFFPLNDYDAPQCAAGEPVVLITSMNTPEQDRNGIVNRSLVALVPQDAPRGVPRTDKFFAFAAHSLPVQGAGDSPFEPVRAFVSEQVRPGNQWVDVDGQGLSVGITVNGTVCNYRVAAVREWKYDPAAPAHFSMYDVRGVVAEFQP